MDARVRRRQGQFQARMQDKKKKFAPTLPSRTVSGQNGRSEFRTPEFGADIVVRTEARMQGDSFRTRMRRQRRMQDKALASSGRPSSAPTLPKLSKGSFRPECKTQFGADIAEVVKDSFRPECKTKKKRSSVIRTPEFGADIAEVVKDSFRPECKTKKKRRQFCQDSFRPECKTKKKRSSVIRTSVRRRHCRSCQGVRPECKTLKKLFIRTEFGAELPKFSRRIPAKA
ncbi:unnamed protein product [Acanthosepion pharaonis]|uniref:Uncharacterized protein n=1 Tax=Acanthosepion pharaonis TaxID=158019 RepID=A0A812ASS7_ACAPH|nr:unnamed protein product [Sepia pharaonis]